MASVFYANASGEVNGWTLCATDGLQRFMDPEIPVVGSLAITWNCTNEVRLR